MNEEILVFAVTALTTTVAYGIGRRWMGFSRDSATNTVRVLFECVGAFVLFLCINVILEVGVIAAVRITTGLHFGFYGVGNIILILLSAAQGIAFRLWWRSG